MDKLNLHDSLRIYLPGLFFCFLFYLIMFGTLNDIAIIVLPSLFVGLLFDIMFRSLCDEFFRKTGQGNDFGYKKEKTIFIYAWKEIVTPQLESYNLNIAIKLKAIEDRKKLGSICKLFFNKIHSSENLLVFRSPKSFGILCFYCFLVCVISILFLISHYFFPIIKPYKIIIPPLIMCYFLAIVGFVLFKGSDTFFKASRNLELGFWFNLSESELKSLAHIINRIADDETINSITQNRMVINQSANGSNAVVDF